MSLIWTKKIAFYLIAFYLITILIGYFIFAQYFLSVEWLAFQFFVIVFFAIGGVIFFDKTKLLSDKKFIKQLFWWSFFIKLIIVFFNYYIFNLGNGFPFMINSDPVGYHKWGEQVLLNFNKGNFNVFRFFPNSDLSDLGGKVYYGSIYYLFGNFGNKIIIARIFNAFFASLTVVYFYKIIRYINNVDVARTSAVLFMLFPIFNLYAGTHYKESIFLFFVMLSAYESYKIFFVKQYKYTDVIWLILSIIASFFFRNVIGPVLILSAMGLVLFNFQKKFSLGIGISFTIVIMVLLISYINMFKPETEQFAEGADTYTEQVIKQTKRNTGGHFSFGNFFTTPFMFIATMPAPIPTIVNDISIRKDFDFGLKTLLSSAFTKGFLAFWAILGIFFLFKNSLKDNSYILLFFAAKTLCQFPW